MVRVLKARPKADQHAKEVGAGLVSGEDDFRGNLRQGTEVAVLEVKWGSRLLENAAFSFVLIVGFRASRANPACLLPMSLSSGCRGSRVSLQGKLGTCHTLNGLWCLLAPSSPRPGG